MRIARVSVDDKPCYGIVEDGARRLLGLTGDPLYQQVSPSGVVVDLDDVRYLSPVIPRSKGVVIEAGVEAEPAQLRVRLVPNTAVVACEDPAPAWAAQHQVLVQPAYALVAKTLVRDARQEAAGSLVLGTCLALLVTRADLDPHVGLMADSSCYLGPWIEVSEDGHNPLGDGLDLEVGDHSYGIDGLSLHPSRAVSLVSQLATLLPGDLVIVPACEPVCAAPASTVRVSSGRLGAISVVTYQESGAPRA